MLSFTGLGKDEEDKKSHVEGKDAGDDDSPLDPLTEEALKKFKQNTGETD